MIDKLRKYHIDIIFAGALLSIIPYFISCFFANPAADDFCVSVGVNVYGFWGNIIHHYQTWGGRYFAMFLMNTNPLIYHWLNGYKVWCFIFFILSYHSVFFMLKQIIETKKHQHFFTIILLSLYMQNMPNLPMNFYWMSGFTTYQSGNILMCYLIGFLIKLTKKDIFSFKYILLCLPFIIACFGTNEITVLISLSILLILFYSGIITIKNRIYLLSIISLLLIFTCVSIFAPGNESRRMNFPESHNLLLSLKFSFLQTVRFVGTWLLSPSIIIAILLLLLSNESIDFKNIQNNFKKLKSSILLVFLISVVAFSFFMVYWSCGILGQHRTVNIAFFFFILCLPLSLILIPKHLILKLESLKPYKGIIAVSFVLSLCITNNTYTIFQDLISGESYKFDKEMQNRFEKLSTCKSNCEMSALKAKPKSLFIADFENDVNYWENNCYMLYFNSGKITLTKK